MDTPSNFSKVSNVKIFGIWWVIKNYWRYAWTYKHKH